MEKYCRSITLKRAGNFFNQEQEAEQCDTETSSVLAATLFKVAMKPEL